MSVGRVAAAVAATLIAAGCNAAPPHTPTAAMQHAGKALRDVIEARVDDPTRRSAALAEVDRLTRELESFGRSVEAWRGEMTRLMTDYRTTRHDIEQLAGVANTSRERFRARVIDSRLALAKTLSADEWEAVADADMALLQQWAAADAAAVQ